MKKFEGIEQIGFTVNKAHNVAFGTVGEYIYYIICCKQFQEKIIFLLLWLLLPVSNKYAI